nr:unnamed protein product [Callosobruchus chinensis]
MDLLEKVTTSDEDLRFMHTKDLISLIGELQEDIIELDNDSERKVQDDTSVQLKALDIITDLLLRSMPALQNFHGSILAALLPQLSSQCQAVRKSTVSACSNLVLCCDNSLYAKLVDHLYDGCSDKNNSQIRTYVQCIAAVWYDDEEDEENDEYSNDADMSWKVRRSAVKCLEAIILTRHNLSTEMSRIISVCLVSRLKEHAENVKSDIFHAYIALLKSSNMNFYQSEMHLVRALPNLLCRKNMRTREECFNLLREVCLTLPGAFSTHIRALIPGILYSLSEHSLYTMKVEVLSFMYCLLTSHQPQVFHLYMGLLVPPVINAVGGRWYFKVTAEALDVLQELIKILRPLDVDSGFVFNPFTENIYGCTLKQLETAAVQEVKEKAISTMGQVIYNLGDHLKDQLPFCLPLFVDRLTDETTRLTTVKALTKIAGSPLGIKLPILPEIMPVLGLFLRKNRDLKLSTLELIDRLLNNYHGDLNVQLLEPIVDEVPPLLDESDLNIAHWALIILRSIATHHPRALKGIRHTIMPQVRQLVKSPLLQNLVPRIPFLISDFNLIAEVLQVVERILYADYSQLY